MLEISNLSKIYPTPKGPYVVLEGLNLEIRQSEFICIIGHSGCGKSTLLSMIAGLNKISDGTIMLNGAKIIGPGPDRGVVFQAPSLFPWMTALENVLLGVRQVFPHGTKREQNDIAKYYLAQVGLEDAFHKKAADLSQGMQQRVGIARAFALKPNILLLDEPFGMLDSLTKTELQQVLIDVVEQEQITAIMVTHDVDEAIFLADRVVMMTSGPYAKIGKEQPIRFQRPRIKVDVMEDPNYYKERDVLIDFLNH
ncbi:MAG: ABC transporter ATP-binding protein [Bacteroidota bacterium]